MNNHNLLTFSLLASASGLLVTIPASAQDCQAHAQCTDLHLIGASEAKLQDALWRGVNDKDLHLLQMAISCGADVNKSDNDGWTRLYTASFDGHLEVVCALIAAGADVNQANNDGEMPLHMAIFQGHLEVIHALIAAGADVNQANTYGQTPLWTASYQGHLEILKALIAAGADVNQANNDGWTPLYRASFDGHLEVVHPLIAAGADVNQADTYGWMPLHMAIFQGHLEVVKVLIDATDSFSLWSRSNIERILRHMITQQHGNSAWTAIIELFEARTGVTRASLAVNKIFGLASSDNKLLSDLSKEELQAMIGDKTLIGIVTVSGLTFDSIVRVGKHFMSQDNSVMIMYITESIMNVLGVEAFSGFIFPGSGDNYPSDKAIFTLEDMPESERTSTEHFYQKAYHLANEHSIPTFGICAGAQHLVLNRGGALMKNKNYSRVIKLQPFNPIHYMTLTDAERASTLDDCETPGIEMNVFRAHSYAAEAHHLGEGIRLASMDGETPLAFYEGFMVLATQFHPESRYNGVSHYGDKDSNNRQTNLLNSFFELCKHHDTFIQSALAEEKTRAEGIAARDAFYQNILNRLDECAVLKGV
jgi:ankyrin repeat protein